MVNKFLATMVFAALLLTATAGFAACGCTACGKDGQKCVAACQCCKDKCNCCACCQCCGTEKKATQ